MRIFSRASRIGLRLAGIWLGSLAITVVALVGGAFLAPEDDIVQCAKCLVILGFLPFVFTFVLSFLLLQRSNLADSGRNRRVVLAGYSAAFSVAAILANLVVVGLLMSWMFLE
jgi:hypothetical protein